MFTSTTLLVSFFATGLGLLAPTVDESPALGPDGLTVASHDLRIELDDVLPLPDLLAAYCDASGVRVMMSPSVRERVEQTTYAGFGGGLTLPADELQGFVEGLLTREGFRLAMTHAGRVPVLSLLDARHDQPHIDSPWLHIPYEHTVHFADNPALLVETVVPCNEADARQVSNSMRMVTNHPWSMVIGMGSENGMFVRGTGAEVARLVDSVLRADRMMVERNAARTAAAERTVEIGTTLHAQADGSMTVELDPVLTATTQATADRPSLAIRVIEVERDFREVADMLKDLTYYRHGAEKAQDLWYVSELGDPVF